MAFYWLFPPVEVNHIKILLFLLNLKVLVRITSNIETVLFSCWLEQYKLVRRIQRKRIFDVSPCRRACYNHGLELIALKSDDDRRIITQLREFSPLRTVVTESIEVVNKDGASAFFSRPRGKRIHFIQDRWDPQRFRKSYPGDIYYITIYGYYYRRTPLWEILREKYDCGCKRSGEQCLYNRHANFHAKKKKHDRR